MGSVFKKQSTRAVPERAEIFSKSGERLARWKVRGKLRTARLTEGKDGGDRIVTDSATYFAKFRDAMGKPETRATGCRDKQAAEQLLKKWEREVEQVKSGTLDRRALDAAKLAAVPLEQHLSAYEQSLIAAEVSEMYRANVLRAVLRVAKDCAFKTPADLNREAVERWLAARITGEEKMSARSRNYYRESLVAFANWCIQTGRLLGHDLDRIPKADQKADPRRQRRALTEDELKRLLVVAVTRPLLEHRTIRRGKRKGEAVAELKPETVARLHALGRERALIYKTLVLTGLRKNELATLTIGQLDLTPGNSFLQLDAADEKSREGNTVAIRDDLAADLRAWLNDKLGAIINGASGNDEPLPMRLAGDRPVFQVPVGLVRILDRDLKAAGIPKRDDRGRTVDVHAMRTTFGTLLSKTGTAPRTAQAAMRHSDIKLTMGVYTDPRLLDVRGAVEKLPVLPLPTGADAVAHQARRTGTEDHLRNGSRAVAPAVAPTRCNQGHFRSSSDTEGSANESQSNGREFCGNAEDVNAKPSLTSAVTEGHEVGLTGFEPATSWSRTKRSSQAELQPDVTDVGYRTPGHGIVNGND
jgi:integrase